MAETFTPSTTTAPPATYSMPNNTELADAEALKTNVLKPLASGVAFALGAGNVSLPARRPQIDTTAAGSVTVGTFSAYFAGAGAYTTLTSPATLTNANIDVSPGSWAVSSVYYIYASWVAGALVLKLSLTAPNAALTNKTGNADLLYLGCVMTDSSGNLIPWRALNGRYHFLIFQPLLGSGAEEVWTTVSLAAVLPPTAQTVFVNLQLVNNSTLARQAYLRPASAVGSYALYVGANARYLTAITPTTASVYNSTYGEIPTGASNDIEYQVSGPDAFCTVFGSGFAEP